jgi:hypothetical protein
MHHFWAPVVSCKVPGFARLNGLGVRTYGRGGSSLLHRLRFKIGSGTDTCS